MNNSNDVLPRLKTYNDFPFPSLKLRYFTVEQKFSMIWFPPTLLASSPTIHLNFQSTGLAVIRRSKSLAPWWHVWSFQHEVLSFPTFFTSRDFPLLSYGRGKVHLVAQNSMFFFYNFNFYFRFRRYMYTFVTWVYYMMQRFRIQLNPSPR